MLLNQASLKPSSVHSCKFSKIHFPFCYFQISCSFSPFPPEQSWGTTGTARENSFFSCLLSPCPCWAVRSSDLGSVQWQEPKHQSCSQPTPARAARGSAAPASCFPPQTGSQRWFSFNCFCSATFQGFCWFFFSHRLPRAQHSFDNFYKSSSVLVICGLLYPVSDLKSF